MIPVRDDPGEVRRTFPWVMLAILALNVVAFIFELGYGNSAALDSLFLSAGVVPIEFTRPGTFVGPPPLLGTPLTMIPTPCAFTPPSARASPEAKLKSVRALALR